MPITLQVAGSAAIPNMVTKGQLNLGLVVDEIDRSGGDAQVFASFAGVIAMPADHRLTRLAAVTPGDLSGVTLICLTPEDRARHCFDAALTQAGVTPDYIIETPNSSTICALALSGDAVSLVNPLTTQGFVERGLILRPLRPRIAFRSLLLFRPDNQRATLVQSFTKGLFALRNSIMIPDSEG